MLIQPTREEFCCLAGEYNMIPVFVELATDLETPVSLYYKLVGDDIGFMLESAETGKNFGRYSFIGVKPFAIFTARAGGSEIAIDGHIRRFQEPPLETLRSFMAEFKTASLPGLPPLAGGAVGYFTYELVGSFERIRGHKVADEVLLSELLFCQVIVVMDHLTHSSRLLVLARPEPGSDCGNVYDAAVTLLNEMKERLRQRAPAASTESRQKANGTVQSNMSKQKYMDLVEQAKEHIRAGDVFQVVISQRLTVPLLEPPFGLYRRLRRVNPSPYMFYLNFGERQLVGASPEMLVKLEAGHITTRPIAGTRPRGYDAADDDRLAAELLADNKECAEHTMLVDLGRNDLGRVCIPGTVTVERFKQVEMFSHVMHIVSDVGGTVDANFGPIDALKACFPAGTLSGAPKVRAMEIIQELEGGNRGPYAGAVGYIDFHGNMDTCITIRTMSIADQKVTVQAGAGIVYDSVPETEYAETMHKAKALIKVMTAEEDDVGCQ